MRSSPMQMMASQFAPVPPRSDPPASSTSEDLSSAAQKKKTSRWTETEEKILIEQCTQTTFVCPTEIIAFSDRVEEFHAISCEVVACSVDSEYSHLAWTNLPRKKGGLGQMNIPLLSDITKQISKDYGVLLEDQGVALRGLFIVDDKGILRQITVNDLPVGRSVDEVLRLVQAFQFTDKHGEVCPAGWRPGSETIVPEVKKSGDYFSKQ